MADDGTGGNIVIPSFLIGKTHGRWLKDKLRSSDYQD